MSETNDFKSYLIRTKTERGKYRKIQTVEVHLDLLKRLKHHAPDLSLLAIEKYLLTLFDNGRAGSYINSYIDTIKMYGRFLGTDIYNSLEYYPEDEFIQATMSDDEIKAFLSLPCPVSKRTDTRSGKVLSYKVGEKAYNTWTLFFKVLAYTGMRPGEVAHLTIEKCDFGRGVFVLPAVDVKTNTFRNVPIPPSVTEDLTTYIKTLSGEYLFLGPRGKVVTDVDWGYNFHKRLERLGIKRKNLRVSSLRPSFITRMLSEDISISKVQKIVGHRRIATTQHYEHLTTKDIIKTIKQDPLSRQSLTFYERFKMFREGVTKLLEDLALSPQEEEEMLKGIS